MNNDIFENELDGDWYLLDNSQSNKMTDELAKEVCSEHELFGLEYVALARIDGRDDFLFSVNK